MRWKCSLLLVSAICLWGSAATADTKANGGPIESNDRAADSDRDRTSLNSRTGIRLGTRPRWDWMISFTGSGRSAGASQCPSDLRGTWPRSAGPTRATPAAWR